MEEAEREKELLALAAKEEDGARLAHLGYSLEVFKQYQEAVWKLMLA